MSDGPTRADGGAPADDAALVAVLLEIERHVGADGWDQPPRLFALVSRAEFAATDPALAAELGLTDPAGGPEAPPDALTAVEQDEFTPNRELTEELAEISWPPTVAGCALSLVRTFLPASAEGEIPDEPGAAAAYVAAHPDAEEIRVVVGVDRAGHRHGVARLASQPGELLAAEDLIPGLAVVLAHTLT